MRTKGKVRAKWHRRDERRKAGIKMGSEPVAPAPEPPPVQPEPEPAPAAPDVSSVAPEAPTPEAPAPEAPAPEA
jgi:hypothetical protein